MAATKASVILTQVRDQLKEKDPSFWSDEELIAIMHLGAIDLWGAILDLHQDHYFTVKDDGTVYFDSNSTTLTGVPTDCFRVQLIEPLDTTVDGVGHTVLFIPRKYKDNEFVIARTLTAQDPSGVSGRQIYYQVTNPGPPGVAPTVYMAPKITTRLPVRLVYNPTVVITDGETTNPIPGGSDNALKAWTIAYAKAKDSDTQTPDAGWLGVYATEKQALLTRLTPRQEQEPEVVEDLFQGFGGLW